MKKKDILVVTGPTATGKTKLAARIATLTGGEIISADSRQVYRGMTIGTGKDLDDYIVDGVRVPCHLIDICEPGYRYNLFEFQRDFVSAYNDIISRDKMPLLCGGTGLYVEAAIKEYRLLKVPPDHNFRKEMEKLTLDELTEILSSYRKLHNRSDSDSVKRAVRAIEIERYMANHVTDTQESLCLDYLLFVIEIDRDLRRERITRRLYQRLDEGMVEEVEGLLKSGVAPDILLYYGLEYKYITQHLTGELNHNEMVSRLETAIHRFSKRQMTWFRGMERRGLKVNWLDGTLSDNAKADIIISKLNDTL